MLQQNIVICQLYRPLNVHAATAETFVGQWVTQTRYGRVSPERAARSERPLTSHGRPLSNVFWSGQTRYDGCVWHQHYYSKVDLL